MTPHLRLCGKYYQPFLNPFAYWELRFMVGKSFRIRDLLEVTVGLRDLIKRMLGGGEEDAGGELEVEELLVGEGAVAESGRTVEVHYTGWLVDGRKFDSSLDRRQPFSFRLGAGQVIAGWDQGVAGMQVGGRRKLTIPPSLGYGRRGAGMIPANAVLIFEVELLGVR
ncbi:MAG: hypothetical protein ACI8S6_001962 [Myxococcota bacterium]|jgi:hypothetical protein